MNIEDVNDWGIEWKLVEFTDTVIVRSITRGRSAAHFIAYSETTQGAYTIFMTDFLDMVINGDVKEAAITGTFKVVKRGCNLGIRLKTTPVRNAVYPSHNKQYSVPSYV